MAKSKTVQLDPVASQNLRTWQAITADLDRLKAIELEYRFALKDQIPFDRSKESGAQTLGISADEKVVLDIPVYYTVARDVPSVMEALGKLHDLNPGAVIDLIRWVPEISTTAYKKLTDEEKRLIAPVLIVKPGTPTLALEQIKKGN